MLVGSNVILSSFSVHYRLIYCACVETVGGGTCVDLSQLSLRP